MSGLCEIVANMIGIAFGFVLLTTAIEFTAGLFDRR